MNLLIILHFVMIGFIHADGDDDIVRNEGFKVFAEWNYLDFFFPNERSEEINERMYEPHVSEPFDADLHPPALFITTPRSRVGVPATLGFILEAPSLKDNAMIAEYPNLNMSEIDDKCDHMNSVYRIKIDECNRLWALDTGTFLRLHICPPQLFVFDLITNTLISKHTFYIDALSRDPRLITPIIDIRNGKCDETFVYIPDNKEYQIFVYDHQEQKSWQVYSERFNQYEEFGVDFKATGSRDDDFQLTLGPVNDHGDRKLYFRGINSGHYGYVNTSFIRNSKIFERSPNAADNQIGLLPYARARTGIETMNKDGILFFHSGYENAIFCWTLESHDGFDHDQTDLVLRDPKLLEHPSSLKITNSSDGRELLLITSIPDDRKTNGLRDPDRINYRIIGGYVDDIIRGTKCGPRTDRKV